MSQVITSTLRPQKTIMVHSPMQMDTSEEHGGSHSAQVTPEPLSSSPGSGVARNQVASENNRTAPQDAKFGQRSDLEINTNSPDRDDDLGEFICVCTPVQKVPRPPNSFILYRSRQQSRVAAEHPGLSNPQISQILGERWANESEEVKALWKTRAMEESKRHRLQYPDYKYQPKRRGSKAQSGPSDEDSGRCPKCNGRYYRAPQTPGAPFTPAKTKGEPMSGHPSCLESEEAHRRRSDFPLGPGGGIRSADERELPSPEAKRRRLTHAAESQSVTPIQVNAYMRTHGLSTRTPPTGGPFSTSSRQHQHVGTPLPHMHSGGMSRPYSGSMPPPPRPPVVGGWSGSGYRRSGIANESLRLPPLQTAIPPSASSARDGDMRYPNYTPIHSGVPMTSTRESPERAPRDQIMGISVSKKLGVLNKICPSLPKSAPGTPGFGSRGPIIAVEGHKDRVLQEVEHAVERALQIAPEEIALKTWNHNFPEDIPVQGVPCEKEEVSFEEALPSILQHTIGWHMKSKEMVGHVQRKEEGSPLGMSHETTSTPAALIKGGFSLTVSDKFACSTVHSINKLYTPVDHWQWMATLWRGIVGPDLIVYVKICSDEEISKGRPVEFQERMGAIIVRIAQNKGLDEATERRLAFEVIEWMRSGWIRDGRPRSS